MKAIPTIAHLGSIFFISIDPTIEITLQLEPEANAVTGASAS